VTPDDRASTYREDDIELAVLWRKLWERKLFILCVTVLGAGVAAYLALTATPMYRAETKVTDARSEMLGCSNSIASQLGGLASLAGVKSPGGDSGPMAKAILNSRELVEQFITRNKLLPQLSPGSSPPSLWRAVRQFRGGVLSIHEDLTEGVTTVAVEWSDAATAARWANEIVALTNELIRARALENSKRNIAYLNEQIADTNVLELREVMYKLVESETKTLMLANGRKDYAFAVIDSAVAPEIRSSPKRTLMVLLGTALGLFVGVMFSLAHDAWVRRRQRPELSAA
jgi:uncharacterized protein involved in exopolysaccharide biosynthesis